MVLPQTATSPQVSESVDRTAAGLSIGYARNLVDRQIGSYILPSCFVEFPIVGGWKMRGSFEYFLSRYEIVYGIFEYKGKTYYGKFGQIWKDFSFQLAVQYRVSSLSSIGISVSADRIYIKQVTPEYLEFRPAFVVDPYDDKVYYFSETIIDRLVAPSLGFFATMELLEGSLFVPFILIQYKLTFVGEKYGKTPLNSQNNFLISAGIKYQF